MPSSFLDFLFPKHSLTQREGEWVTAEELPRLVSRPVVLEQAQLRGLGMQTLNRVVAATDYQSAPLLKKAVHTFKYRRVRGLADVLGSVLLEASLQTWGVGDSAPVLCPVPLHWSRRFARGFNQAELLARFVAQHRGVECRELLRRTRATGHQAHRNRLDRFAAMKEVFSLLEAKNIPAFVVLIDDVSTTGSTLDACAAVLKRAGAVRVEGLVVAHD